MLLAQGNRGSRRRVSERKVFDTSSLAYIKRRIAKGQDDEKHAVSGLGRLKSHLVNGK
jgi:hypothetical protein